MQHLISTQQEEYSCNKYVKDRVCYPLGEMAFSRYPVTIAQGNSMTLVLRSSL